MENTDKSGPHAPASRLREALEGAFDAAEASENAARSAPGAAAAARPLARLGARLRAPQAPGPSDPRWRSSADPGDRAEASASDGSGSAAAGAPSPAPPELAGAAAAGTPAKLGAIASSGPAAQAWGPRRPKVAEDRRDQAAGPSAPAPPAPVGADRRHAPPDGDAPPDPKRDPHRGVRDGADGRKPEGAAL